MSAPGRLRWTEPSDQIAVDVHRYGAGWGVTAIWPDGRGGGAARDTRDEAVACVPDLLALCREVETLRVPGRTGR